MLKIYLNVGHTSVENVEMLSRTEGFRFLEGDFSWNVDIKEMDLKHCGKPCRGIKYNFITFPASN